MRDHIRILGILNIIMGSLGALVGVVVLVILGGAAGVLSAVINSQAQTMQLSDGMVAAPIVATIGIAIAIFFFALSLPSIIGGWGLLHFRPWSRILMIIVSVFNLFHIPIGTALGVYGLWVLLSQDGQRLLESGGQYGVSAAPTPYGPGAVYPNAPNYPSQTYPPPQFPPAPPPPPGV